MRGAFDLGAPHGSELALRAVRRTLVQAITRAPRAARPVRSTSTCRCASRSSRRSPATDEERALARAVADAAPRTARDRAAAARRGRRPRSPRSPRAIAREPNGADRRGRAAGGVPARAPCSRSRARAGYPLLAEAGSQLRFGARRRRRRDRSPRLSSRSPDSRPHRALVVQLGAEPVARELAGVARRTRARWVLADATWRDPEARRARVIGIGDVARVASLAALAATRTRRRRRHADFAPRLARRPRRATRGAPRRATRSPRCTATARPR